MNKLLPILSRRTFFLCSLLLLCLAMGAGYGLAIVAADRFVKRQAESFSQDWARFISGRVPNLEAIAAGSNLSERDRQLLIGVTDFGDVFRFKLFSPDGNLTLISDYLFMPSDTTATTLGEHNEKAAAVVASGLPFTSIEDGTRKPDRPDVYAESYVPVFRDGRLIAISEVYIDQTEFAAVARQDYMRHGIEIAGLIVLFLTGPVIGISLLLRSVKRKNAALEIETENARRADQAKSDFVANVSHELRTPMNGVLGMAQILRMGNLEDSQKRQLDILINSAESQMLIINDLLDFSKIENGSFKLNSAPFSADEVLNDIFVLQTPSARSKGLSFDLVTPAVPAPAVIGDEHALRQVLNNIIGNAVKFTVTGSVDVSLSADQTEDMVTLVFRVVDTGPGISAEHHAKIFDRFSQVDSSSTRAAGGTGLGLTITRSLVDLMQGRINLESAVGVGSTFTVAVTLPAAETEGEIDARAA